MQQLCLDLPSDASVWQLCLELPSDASVQQLCLELPSDASVWQLCLELSSDASIQQFYLHSRPYTVHKEQQPETTAFVIEKTSQIIVVKTVMLSLCIP